MAQRRNTEIPHFVRNDVCGEVGCLWRSETFVMGCPGILEVSGTFVRTYEMSVGDSDGFRIPETVFARTRIRVFRE